jgi:hypothetical protein
MSRWTEEALRSVDSITDAEHRATTLRLTPREAG